MNLVVFAVKTKPKLGQGTVLIGQLEFQLAQFTVVEFLKKRKTAVSLPVDGRNGKLGQNARNQRVAEIL